jgi:hypothetical protein
MAKTSTEETTKQTFRVPEKDPLGQAFPGIWINGFHFEPGKSYEVDPTTFESLTSILDGWMQESLRLLQRKVDLKALRQIFESRGYWAGVPEE